MMKHVFVLLCVMIRRCGVRRRRRMGVMSVVVMMVMVMVTGRWLMLS